MANEVDMTVQGNLHETRAGIPASLLDHQHVIAERVIGNPGADPPHQGR